MDSVSLPHPGSIADGSATSRQREVVNLVSSFVEPSQGWLNDLIRLPGEYRARVLCESRISEPDVLDVQDCLPKSPRFGPEWLARNLNTRAHLRIGPRNYWARALRRLDPSAAVYHAHFGPAGWLAADSGLRPLVASFYGYDATEEATLRYWGLGYPALFREASLIVAEGPAMAERLRMLGAPSERLRVLPLPAPTDELTWRAPALHGPVRVVMAGRFVEKKGFHLGVEAFARARVKDATLTLIGDGPEKARLRALCERFGIENRVRFAPFLGREAYRDELRASDIIIQPSVTATNGDCEGGAPTVLLDALAIGLVVVASDHADLPFVAGDNAFIAPEGKTVGLIEALRSAVRARPEWRAISRGGRAHVERQHAPRTVAAVRDDIYAEAASTIGS